MNTFINFRIKLILGAAFTALSLLWLTYFLTPAAKEVPNLGSPFSLVNQRGEAVTEAIFKGKPHVIFFGFTHCPDICPTTLSDLTTAFDQMKAGFPDAYFITIDPTRDTAAALKLYLSSFHPSITALTGSQTEIDKVVQGYKIYAKKNGETFDHSSSLFFFDKKGAFVGTGAYKENLDTVIEKMKLLMRR
jgi:protein SCO1